MVDIKGLGTGFDMHRFGEKPVYISGIAYGAKRLGSALVGIPILAKIYRFWYGAGRKNR
jgi:hypothetical protein